MARGLFVGLATLDVVHRVDDRPGHNQKVTASAQSTGVGGPAANAALTFAGLGGEATLVTALGRSSIAALVREELERFGVRVVDTTPDADAEPPVSAVAVHTLTGARSVVSLDAVATVVPVPAGLGALVATAEVTLVDGHYPNLAVETARIAAVAGRRVIVDAGRWKPAMEQLVALATDLVCSNDFRLPDHESQAATLDALTTSGPVRIVVTRGADPVLWWEDGDRGEVPVPTVPVVDTLGAGDAFHGGYAFYSAAGDQPLSLPELVARCSEVAGRRCQVTGPRAWLAELAELARERRPS